MYTSVTAVTKNFMSTEQQLASITPFQIILAAHRRYPVQSKKMEQPRHVTDQLHVSLQSHSKLAAILPSLGQPRPARFSASLLCLSCQGKPVWTNVETRISRSGWIWAAACLLFGSPWFALLVKCLDCFREWIHTCPRCGKELAVFSPSASFAVVTALVLVSLLTLLLDILLLFLLFDWWFN